MTSQADIVAEIREQHRMREDFLKAEGNLTRQAKAICRRFCEGDKQDANALYEAMVQPDKRSHRLTSLAYASIAPLLASQMPITEAKKVRERALKRLARQLPIWPWVKEVRGATELTLAKIIGEACPVEATGLGDFPSTSTLYKRLGLAVIDGQRQRCVADRKEAKRQGYNPRRRAIIYAIGEDLIINGDYYRSIYLARLHQECAKAESEGLTIATTMNDTVARWIRRGLPEPAKVTKLQSHHRGTGHIHNRAKRYMEKAFVRDLWKAWLAVESGQEPEYPTKQAV